MRAATLKWHRKRLKKTQGKMASFLSCTRRSIINWEKGYQRIPSLVAKYLHVHRRMRKAERRLISKGLKNKKEEQRLVSEGFMSEIEFTPAPWIVAAADCILALHDAHNDGWAVTMPRNKREMEDAVYGIFERARQTPTVSRNMRSVLGRLQATDADLTGAPDFHVGLGVPGTDLEGLMWIGLYLEPDAKPAPVALLDLGMRELRVDGDFPHKTH